MLNWFDEHQCSSMKPPLTLPMFSRSTNPSKLFSILCLLAEVRCLIWRITRTENIHISACIQRSGTILTAIPITQVPKVPEFNGAIFYTVYGKPRSDIQNLAKLGNNYVYQSSYNVVAQLQRLYSCFKGS